MQWLKEQATPKQFILVSSVLVGLSSGIVAVILKYLIHLILNYLKNLSFIESRYLIAFLPMLGIFLTVLIIRFVLKGKIEKGFSSLHKRIKKNSSNIPREQMYDQVLTSAVTVGFGGSAGIEAPILLTGAAFGSNYAKTYRLNYNDRSLLLACGIAGGIAAAFNAPIAGVLFALEALLLDISITAFIPLILAAASGALASKILLHSDVLFSFTKTQAFNYKFTLLYVILGVLAGLLAVYHSRVFQKVEVFIEKRKINKYLKALLGGIILAGLILVLPSLFGEGVDGIKAVSENELQSTMKTSLLVDYLQKDWQIILFFIGIILIKPIATALTIGSGGNGGNFAPALFIGAFLGFTVAKIINICFDWDVSSSNFTLVGMAGVLSGLYHAPLTSIFLIAEITGGYTLMIPLMIVSSISYAISRFFEPFSMDTKNLAQDDDVYSTSKDLAILGSLSINDLITRDFNPLHPEMTFMELLEVIKNSDKTVFPVIDSNSRLRGIVFFDNVREYIFQAEKYKKLRVKDLMEKIKASVNLDDGMETILLKFEKNNAYILPVESSDGFVGFIRKSIVLNEYRKTLIQSTIN